MPECGRSKVNVVDIVGEVLQGRTVFVCILQDFKHIKL